MTLALSEQTWSALGAGLVCGVVATGATAGAARASAGRGPTNPGVPGIAGVAVAAATLGGLWHTGHLPGGLVGGLLLLLAVQPAFTLLKEDWRLLPALALPGAWVIAVHTGLPPTLWIRTLVVVGVVVGGPLVARFDLRWGTGGYPPVLVVVTALGVYLTVPETEHAIVLLGAAAPVALLGWPRARASLGVAGALLVVALVLWVSAADGAARPTAIVGGAACLGLLVLEPVARMSHRPGRSLALRGVVGVVCLHGGLVLMASRGAGLQPQMGWCVALVSVEVLVAVAVMRQPRDTVVLAPARSHNGPARR